MESLCELMSLLDPSYLALISTAVFVTFASASRALSHGKEMERNGHVSVPSITLDRRLALVIPLLNSCNLLLMFYLFSSVSHVVTAFTAVASAVSLFFCLSPYVAYLKTQLGLVDPIVCTCRSKSLTRTQGALVLVCIGTVSAWLVSGHWVLNNLLGICLCIAIVSHIRLPNIKISAFLLVCVFVYDIFWVFFSERFFGANVMAAVATQRASNPVHEVANSLILPGLHLVTKKLVFPTNLMGGMVPGSPAVDYKMLGLGDMV